MSKITIGNRFEICTLYLCSQFVRHVFALRLSCARFLFFVHPPSSPKDSAKTGFQRSEWSETNELTNGREGARYHTKIHATTCDLRRSQRRLCRKYGTVKYPVNFQCEIVRRLVISYYHQRRAAIRNRVANHVPRWIFIDEPTWIWNKYERLRPKIQLKNGTRK